MVTDRGLRKDLFELAAAMDDSERVSFESEEGLRQLSEELEKNEKRNIEKKTPHSARLFECFKLAKKRFSK